MRLRSNLMEWLFAGKNLQCSGWVRGLPHTQDPSVHKYWTELVYFCNLKPGNYRVILNSAHKITFQISPFGSWGLQTMFQLDNHLWCRMMVPRPPKSGYLCTFTNLAKQEDKWKGNCSLKYLLEVSLAQSNPPKLSRPLWLINNWNKPSTHSDNDGNKDG